MKKNTLKTKFLKFSFGLCLGLTGLFTPPSFAEKPTVTATKNQYDGFVWVLTAPNQKQKIYLVGSMHVLPEKTVLPAAIFTALADSQTIYFENQIEDSDQEITTRLTSKYGLCEQEGCLWKAMPDALLERMSAYRPEKELGNIKPWLAAMILSLRAYQSAGMAPEYGVENQIKKARKPNQRVMGLEPIKDSLLALSSLSSRLQYELLDQTIQDLKRYKPVDFYERWRSGNQNNMLVELQRLRKVHPEAYQTIITQRNQAWLKMIQQHVNENKNQNTMVVVGALHLFGEVGLLPELLKLGWTAQRL